jgi:hypothetical protein
MSKTCKQFPALEAVTSDVVGTEQAAYYLNRKPRTLHQWHWDGTGPIRPSRINGRLAWHVSRIKELVSEVAK